MSNLSLWRVTREISFVVLGLYAALALAPQAYAGVLPIAVDGQPLPSLAPMLEHVTPAVVNINSKTRVRVRNPMAEDPFFRQFFGLQNAPRERIEQSLGSGVIIDAAKGYVLTNNHVIDGADDIAVTLHDGRTLKAKLVGSDPDTDVAVIQMPAENLSALVLADTNKLQVGDFVVAVGNPFGLGQTVTSGIVSALGRSGLRGMGYQSFIQTDASINPGNSGGALVNLRGELVGINSQIVSPSGASAGIGFAIPANLAGDVMRQLISSGSVKRGTLGIEAQDLTPEIARMLEIEPSQGVVVTRVQNDSPSASAGLKPGDVITAVNGKPVATEQELHNAEGLLPVGSAIQLKLLRDGKPIEVSVRTATEQLATSSGAKLDPRLDGAEFADLGERQHSAGLSGISITRVVPGSRAAASGLKNGDIVFAVNQVEIGSVRELERLGTKRVRQLLLSVVRGNNSFLVPLQ